MNESIAFQLTQEALAAGELTRHCECPAHLTGLCPARSWEECSCHNHGADGSCTGVMELDICKDCGRPLPPRVILGCGCVQCEPCAVNTLLAKPWAKSKTASELLPYFGESDPDQRRRLYEHLTRIADSDSTDQPPDPDGSEKSEREFLLDQLRNLWTVPFAVFPSIASNMPPFPSGHKEKRRLLRLFLRYFNASGDAVSALGRAQLVLKEDESKDRFAFSKRPRAGSARR